MTEKQKVWPLSVSWTHITEHVIAYAIVGAFVSLGLGAWVLTSSSRAAVAALAFLESPIPLWSGLAGACCASVVAGLAVRRRNRPTVPAPQPDAATAAAPPRMPTLLSTGPTDEEIAAQIDPDLERVIHSLAQADGEWVQKDVVASAAKMSRTAAEYHLDRLIKMKAVRDIHNFDGTCYKLSPLGSGIALQRGLTKDSPIKPQIPAAAPQPEVQQKAPAAATTSAKAIRDAIMEASPYQEDAVRDAYIGLRVDWLCTYYALTKRSEGAYSVAFSPEDSVATVYCYPVNVDKFPELKVAKKGHPARIVGTIGKARASWIELTDCHIELLRDAS